MLRVSDSIAFVAAARHCYVVVDDAENKRRLFVKAKNNLSPDMAALSYTVDTRPVGTDPETNELIAAPYIVWGNEHVNVTATEAMQAEDTGVSKSGPRDIAKKFLADILALGPLPKNEIKEAADANLISNATLRRAKDDLGVIAKKAGVKEGWTWQLPAQNCNRPTTAVPVHIEPFTLESWPGLSRPSTPF